MMLTILAIRITLILLSFIAVFLKAEMPLTDIRGLNAIVTEHYQHLSPINGLIWWENHLIENLYRHGDKNHATVQLLKDLFYLQRDQVTFDVTTLNRNPARYFKESTVGAILAILESYRKYDVLTGKIKKKLFIELKAAIKNDINFQELYEQAQKTKEHIISRALESSEDYVHLMALQKVTQEIKKIRVAQKKATKGEFAAISKKLAEKLAEQKKLTNQFGSLQQLEKKPGVRKIYAHLYQEDLSRKALKKITSHIIVAFQESLSNIYVPFTVHTIFLAFLWKIAEVKHDIVLFTHSFNALYQDNNAVVFNPEALEKYLVAPPYDKNDFEALKEKYKSGILAQDIVQDYGEVIFYLYASMIWNSIIPPLVDSVAKTKYKGIEFSDCVETAIRNFINCLIFNPKLLNFDITGIERKIVTEKIQFATTSKEFYSRYPNPLKAQLLEVHNAWLNVVSEIPSVVYKKPEKNPFCEIKTSFVNVMKVINYCMFGNASSFHNLSNAEKLNVLCHSALYLNLTWHTDVPIDNSKFDNNMAVVFKHDDKPIIEWIFSPYHTYLISWLKSAYLPDIPFAALLQQFQPQSTTYQDSVNNNKIIAIMSFNMQQMLIGLMPLAKDEALSSKINTLLHSVIPFLTAQDIDALALKILLNKRKILYPMLEEIVKQNISERNHILSLIIRYQVQELYSVIAQSFQQLSRERQQELLLAIIQAKAVELYSLVRNEFKKFHEPISKAILKNKEAALFGLLEKEFATNKKKIANFFTLVIKFDIEYFYSMLMQDFLSLNEYEQRELIKEILKRQRASLYNFLETLEGKTSDELTTKIKEALTIQKELALLIQLTKKIKVNFKELLDIPTEKHLEMFEAAIEDFEKNSTTFMQKIPQHTTLFVQMYIHVLKKVKKIWNSVFEKTQDMLQDASEESLNHVIKDSLLKKHIKKNIKHLEENKNKTIKLLKKQKALLENT